MKLVGVKIFIIRILRSLIPYWVMRAVRNWFPISDSLPNYFKWYPNEPNVRRDEDLRTKWRKNRLLHQRMIRASRSTNWTGLMGYSQVLRITIRTSTGSPRSCIKGKSGHSGRDTILDYRILLLLIAILWLPTFHTIPLWWIHPQTTPSGIKVIIIGFGTF